MSRTASPASSPPEPYVLALDPGGTKCEALLVAVDGTLLAHCRLQDWNLGGRSPEVVQRTIARTLGRHTPAKLIVVSLYPKLPRRWLPGRLQCRVTHCCVSESGMALAVTRQTYGCVVIAGTGTRVTVHRPDGRSSSLDMLGPVLGDSGSGYYIGREALRTVARELQLRRPTTRLRRRVLRACECRTLGQLVHFSLLPRDRSLIASLTRIVDEEARRGDRTARRLLQEGAGAMAAVVRDLVMQLGVAREAYPLIGAGSVAVQSDIYWRELCRQVRQFAPRFRPQRVALPPVAGLAAIGLRNRTAIKKLFTLLQKETGK
jgi:N-acetylglucosamine kinase-like BadF-type ATPase